MIQINGTEYKIIETRHFEWKGEQRKELKLQKPKGRKLFYVVVYANSSMSEVV